MRSRALVPLVLLVLAVVLAVPASAHQTDPIVRGVLFFSPTCPHCEYVIQEFLPPLFDEHGGPWDLVYDETVPESQIAFYLLTNGTLEVLLVDVTVEAGGDFFEATTEALAIGSNGVPRLIVSNQVMIGSADIPARLPGLIDAGLAADGIDWPALPDMASVLETVAVVVPDTTTTTASPASTAGSSTTPSSVPSASATIPIGGEPERGFGDDPAGTALAIGVLILILGALAASVGFVRRPDLPYRPGGLVPLLIVAGLVIAAYLAYVEIGGSEAVCGPVGDCNIVQQSDYASIAGIPNGVLGFGVYLVIAVMWAIVRRGPQRRADLARVMTAAVTIGGVVVSAWLTFAEAFLIHATCAWCIASALVITGLMWLTVPDGVAAWRRLAPASDVQELAT